MTANVQVSKFIHLFRVDDIHDDTTAQHLGKAGLSEASQIDFSGYVPRGHAELALTVNVLWPLVCAVPLAPLM